MHGTTYLYIEQWPVATGIGAALADGDRVAVTYRGHGHALSVGVDPQAPLDEMLGRSTGVCCRRAGSVNVIDLQHGLKGSFGIIGCMSAAVAFSRLPIDCPDLGIEPLLTEPRAIGVGRTHSWRRSSGSGSASCWANTLWPQAPTTNCGPRAETLRETGLGDAQVPRVDRAAASIEEELEAVSAGLAITAPP